MTTSPSDDRAYIGIDPGKKGAVVILTDGITAEYPTPLVCRKHHDPAGMAQLLRRENIGELWRCAALEKVHAMPGQGVTSMFSFGTSWGIWQGILAAMKIPYILVGPREWQKHVCGGLGGDPKARARQAALAQLPQLNLRPGRCRTPHQGVADAACLALYARWYFRDR